MPYTNSIENIQKKCPPTERLGLLTKKDLHNVSRDFEVDESILHAEEAVSVDLQNNTLFGGAGDQRGKYNDEKWRPVTRRLANRWHWGDKDEWLPVIAFPQLHTGH
ncbi:hypothetical protein TNCV_4160561 [Trichonephila clavipes]|nr:hypothetical protein TNCV_4160561 [Trichonephila clavipes]